MKAIKIKRGQIKDAITKTLGVGVVERAPLGWRGQDINLHGSKDGNKRGGRYELIQIVVHSDMLSLLVTDREGDFLCYTKYCQQLGSDKISECMHKDIANVAHMIQTNSSDSSQHKKTSTLRRWLFINQ